MNFCYNHRTAFLRLILIIYRMRNQEEPVTTVALAEEFNCCIKTISRDCQFLKKLGCPISYDRKLWRWVWNPTAELPWWLGGPIREFNPELTLLENAWREMKSGMVVEEKEPEYENSDLH